MKVAVVTDAIYPYHKGGKEKRIYEITTRLARKGYHVDIYCMNWWHGKTEKVENGVFLHAITNYHPLYGKTHRSISQAIFFTFGCFKLMMHDFDVIEVDHMPHLILFPLKLVCLLKRKPLLVTWNEVWGRAYWVSYMGILGNIAYFIELASVQTASKIIAISAHTAKKLRQELHYTKEIVIIPNGIDLAAIQKVKPAKIKSDIIFAGRLLHHKQVDLLLRSIALLTKNYPKISCVIIGQGPEKKRLITLAKSLTISENVHFMPPVESQYRLYALFKSAKLFVLPSNREGFSIVVLEANACGLPVITINHKDNAAQDLIKKNQSNGLISNANELSIAKSIIKLLRNPISQKNCIKVASNYDWNTITPQVETAYNT